MGLHALQDIREHADGGDRVGAFVEHYAFRPLSHGGVGDFRAGGNAFLGEAFEDLGRPDDGYVGCLADPEHFFLNFGKALIAAFDSQIAAGNHDPDRTGMHGRQDQLRKIIKSFARFNFQDQPQMPGIHPFKMVEELAYVGFGAHEGVADDVGVLNNEFQGLQVVRRDRWNIDLGFGQIDALLRAQLLAISTRLRYFHGNNFLIHGTNHTANFAVVEPDRITWLGMVKNLRQRDANARGGQELTGLAIGCWPSDGGGSSQQKRVAQLEQQRLRQVRKFADGGLANRSENVVA